jgi:RNA polymerase sigma-70 factor (ECF subfamily)
MPASGPPLSLVAPEHDDADRRAAAARVEVLFRAHYAALVTFAAHYTRARDVAEEVVQETFLALWERWEREGAGESDAVTRSYLFSAVRYRVLSVLRHERVARRWSEREVRELALDARDAVEHPGPAALDADDLARAVRRAVAGLSEKTRVVFLLSRERGLTYTEIAEVLDVSVKTVELHMTRALKALRANLRGVALGALVLVALAGAWAGALGRAVR